MSRLPREIASSILLTIFKNGEMTMTQIQKETGLSTITVLNYVEKLMIADLLEERRQKELPRRRLIKLSGGGSRAATLLNLISQSGAGSRELLELGVRAGEMRAYRKAATLLKQQNVTRDYAIAEFLVSDLEQMAEYAALMSKSLPIQMKEDSTLLNGIVGLLKAKVVEGRRHLDNQNIRGSAESVAAAWKEITKHYAELERINGELKERKLEDLSRMIDLIIVKCI